MIMMKSLTIVLPFIDIALGASCNWYVVTEPVFAIPENGCSYANFTGEELSAGFFCDADDGYIYNWNNIDCSGTPNFTQLLNSTSDLFDCSLSDTSCSTIELLVNNYDNTDCSGDPTANDYINYVLIDQVSCSSASDDFYFTITATEDIGVEVAVYSDSDCTEEINSTVTIEDDGCEETGNGNSTGFTFKNNGDTSDSGTSDSDTGSSIVTSLYNSNMKILAATVISIIFVNCVV